MSVRILPGIIGTTRDYASNGFELIAVGDVISLATGATQIGDCSFGETILGQR